MARAGEIIRPMRGVILAASGVVGLLGGAALASPNDLLVLAQSQMPVIPPPSQRAPSPPQQPSQAPASRPVSLEDLARVGFDVKAIERAGQTEGRYVIMMQRGGELRTCLMRIQFQRGQQPQRQSACF